MSNLVSTPHDSWCTHWTLVSCGSMPYTLYCTQPGCVAEACRQVWRSFLSWCELYGLAVRLPELSEEWKWDVLASWLTLFQPVWLTCRGTSREPLQKVVINLRHATALKWRVALCWPLEAKQAMPDAVVWNHKHMYIPREICASASQFTNRWL